MPATGLSLHIGLNEVNPDHYGGWDGALQACIHDARDMEALAAGRGFEPRILLDGEATAEAVTGAIEEAAGRLRSGDLFLLTYSGHGGQVPDTNGDEIDPGRMDETWVLWDRQLVDDELWELWSKFRAGVRISVFSDSCHSGTVTRVMPAFPASGPVPRVRWLPPKQATKVYRAHRDLYDGIQEAVPAGEQVKVRASVILVSGCQDNQLSLDGDRNGLFTANLRKVWRNGAFEGGYRRFRDRIAQRMPSQQTPNYTLVGRPDPFFEAQTPFTL
jgi:hypothetical protein